MFASLRHVLVVAGSCKKPDQKAFSDLLGPLQAGIEAVTRFKEANRKDRQWFNHLSLVAEGAPAVGWITVVCHRSAPTRHQHANLITHSGTKTRPLRRRRQRFLSILCQPSNPRVQRKVSTCIWCLTCPPDPSVKRTETRRMGTRIRFHHRRNAQVHRGVSHDRLGLEP